MPHSRILHGFRFRLRRAALALLVGLVLGQPALVAHAMDHALDDGSPVCEVCTVTQSTADTAAVPAVMRLDPAPNTTPFTAGPPPAPRLLGSAARDPPPALR
ncbi:hypothetical protein [Thiohalorhabdus sp.]|uniref:hypothetical protein n=1 Tax=Thiohalorhabdus sp. TaxID=3094134 RepID=UPI002FC30DEF